jgi:hypothetical protein
MDAKSNTSENADREFRKGFVQFRLHLLLLLNVALFAVALYRGSPFYICFVLSMFPIAILLLAGEEIVRWRKSRSNPSPTARAWLNWVSFAVLYLLALALQIALVLA